MIILYYILLYYIILYYYIIFYYIILYYIIVLYYYIILYYIILCIYYITPYSKCMALTYFFRGGCAIYLTVKEINPKFTRNSKCARRWRNPTSAKWAKLRHLPYF